MSNHLSGDSVSPSDVGSPYVGDCPWFVIAAGTSVEVLPAPPAGKVYFIHRIHIVNNDAAQTAGYRVNVGGLPSAGSLLTTSIAASSSAVVSTLIAGAAVSVFATGLGAITAIPQYTLVRDTVAAFPLALTNAYAAIPGIVPPAGYTRAVPFHIGGLTGFLSGGYIMNADAASTTVSIELTRGATVTTYTLAAVTAFSRLVSSSLVPGVRAGDIVKAKVAVSPLVAGTVVLWNVHHTVRAA